jgi:hypothetical protein
MSTLGCDCIVEESSEQLVDDVIDTLLDLTITLLERHIKDSGASESSQELDSNGIQICWFNVEISKCKCAGSGLVIESHLWVECK